MASNQLQDRQVRGEHCPLFPPFSLWFSPLSSLAPCDVRHPHAPIRPYIRDLPRTATSQRERGRTENVKLSRRANSSIRDFPQVLFSCDVWWPLVTGNRCHVFGKDRSLSPFYNLIAESLKFNSHVLTTKYAHSNAHTRTRTYKYTRTSAHFCFCLGDTVYFKHKATTTLFSPTKKKKYSFSRNFFSLVFFFFDGLAQLLGTQVGDAWK